MAHGNCFLCGKEFLRNKTGPAAKYCSKICLYRSDSRYGYPKNWVRLTFRHCHECNKGFIIEETGRLTQRQKYCSEVCAYKNYYRKVRGRDADELQKNLMCLSCNKGFDQTSVIQRFCSEQCRNRASGSFKTTPVRRSINCKRCGKLFDDHNGRAKYCSRTCRRAGTHSDYRTRARRWNVEYDDSVTIAALIARFGRYCAECNELILGEHSSKANQDGPSIDHIVPMSAGGGHVWSNVELVHLRCNVKRWNAYRKVLSDASQ